MNVSYHDISFTISVNQTVMLYVLNLYSDICQLVLNKMEKTMKKVKVK